MNTAERRRPVGTWAVPISALEHNHGMEIDSSDPVGLDLVQAIRSGDVATLQRILAERPGLAATRLRGVGGRTPLHVAADWPGYFPNGPAVVRILIAAGADPNARGEGKVGETPLHWAASSDDLDVADALIDGGADVESPGGSIGTPLDNALGYGCWHVARRLVERGAKVDKLWHAAALGQTGRVEAMLTANPAPTAQDITQAFWHACHGGQLRVADLLLRRGADIHTTPDYAHGNAADIAAGLDTRRQQLLTWLAHHGVTPATGRP